MYLFKIMFLNDLVACLKPYITFQQMFEEIELVI